MNLKDLEDEPGGLGRLNVTMPEWRLGSREPTDHEHKLGIVDANPDMTDEEIEEFLDS